MVAKWWQSNDDGKIKCLLCPRECVIDVNRTGFCGVRKNIDGKLQLLVYGKPVTVHVDPIEKKPLYHFLPGAAVFSIGTVGCNLGCDFCQNWDISRASFLERKTVSLTPEKAVRSAKEHDCSAIAFTYNEPTIFGEYVYDISSLARKAGLKTVMVTNGYIRKEAIEEIYPLIDAANIDLKSFSDQFYHRYCQARLEPVLDAIVNIRQTGTFIELTTLLIPGLNDSNSEIESLSDWIVRNLGEDVPLHFSAFHPGYKINHIQPTPKSTLDRARRIAMNTGIRYVYEGNIAATVENNTYCPKCQSLLIERHGFSVIRNEIHDGKCSCGMKIPVVELA